MKEGTLNKTNYAIHGDALRTRVKEGRKEEARRKGNQYTAGGVGGIRVDKSKQAFVRSRGFVRIVRCMQPRGRRRAREEKEDRKSKRKKSLLR